VWIAGRLKPTICRSGGIAIEGAEKVGFRVAEPEGAIDFRPFAVCLKAYPDTNPEFFQNL
jgi:hypothetical protein